MMYYLSKILRILPWDPWLPRGSENLARSCQDSQDASKRVNPGNQLRYLCMISPQDFMISSKIRPKISFAINDVFSRAVSSSGGMGPGPSGMTGMEMPMGGGQNVQQMGGGQNFQQMGGGQNFQQMGGGQNVQQMGGGHNFQQMGGGQNVQQMGGGQNFAPPSGGNPMPMVSNLIAHA